MINRISRIITLRRTINNECKTIIAINRWCVYHSQSWVVYDIVLPTLTYIYIVSGRQGTGQNEHANLRYPTQK